MNPLRLVLALGFSLVSAAAIAAPLTYRESVSGDLSNDGNAPTMLAFDAGQNHVFGRMGKLTGPVDKDIFTFTVPTGHLLTSIFLAIDPAENSFLAIAAGPTIRTDVTHPGENGSSHLSNLLTRQPGEMLEQLALFKEFGGTTSGVTNPLGPGTYSMWFQETFNEVDYQFSITITPVPEPAYIALGLGGLCVLAGLRRRMTAMHLMR